MRYRVFILLLSLTCGIFAAPAPAPDPEFIVITDIHYGAKEDSRYGYDTGPNLLHATIDKLKELSKQASFILNLGDLPTHGLRNQAKKEAYEQAVFQALYVGDKAKKPLFYIPGNNDSLGGNYQAFQYKGRSPLNLAKGWRGACAFCQGLIIDGSHMLDQGYYSSYVIPNNKEIMLIAINTAPLVYIVPWWPRYANQDQDAQAELLWLEKQLETHSAKQLLIAMHVPLGVSYLGNSFWKLDNQKAFIALLDKYQHQYGQITLLSSHTHADEIRKISLSQDKAIYDYSTAAVSRVHYNNPAIKLVKLNQQNRIANYTTYYTTNVTHWGNESFQALGSSEAIFPSCKANDLADCLDSLTNKQVCSALGKDFFYAAKSRQPYKYACSISYFIQ